MTIYDYIANSNPSAASRIINSFGYSVSDPTNMSSNLSYLVTQEGEPALKAILDAHPDKDIIIETFSTPKMEPQTSCNCKGRNCSCGRGDFANASGSENGITQASMSAHHTNVFLFDAALILAVAIITKK